MGVDLIQNLGDSQQTICYALKGKILHNNNNEVIWISNKIRMNLKMYYLFIYFETDSSFLNKLTIYAS